MLRIPITRNEFKTKTAKFIVCVIGLFFAMTASAYAGDIYISQNGAGSGKGTSCSDAYSAAWFNSNASGGNTYHLCGTFTGTAGSTMLKVPASGTASAPLNIVFEPGAVLSAPYWNGDSSGNSGGTGAIYINGKSYITIDGKNQGTIKNTANGTSLSYHKASTGIVINNGNHITVKDLTISNMYMITNGSDTAGQYSTGIYVEGSNSNINITGNTISDASIGLITNYGGTAISNIMVGNNTVSDIHWGIDFSSGDSGSSISNVQIYGNDISNWGNWATNANYHTDGIILASGTNEQATFYIYNNYIHGDLGTGSPTAFVFVSQGDDTSPSITAYIYNNLFVATSASAYWAAIWLGGDAHNDHIINNTFVGQGSSTSSISGINISGASWGNTGEVIENNIFYNMSHPILDDSPGNGSGIKTCNYNVYYGASSSPFVLDDGGTYASFSTWQGYGFDANSSTSSPNLNSSYQIASASGSAYQKGTNLTSLGLSTLSTDKSGIARPSSGAWDIGAYQFASGSTLSAPAEVHLISSN